jgi:hypothetical protein
VVVETRLEDHRAGFVNFFFDDGVEGHHLSFLHEFLLLVELVLVHRDGFQLDLFETLD